MRGRASALDPCCDKKRRCLSWPTPGVHCEKSKKDKLSMGCSSQGSIRSHMRFSACTVLEMSDWFGRRLHENFEMASKAADLA